MNAFINKHWVGLLAILGGMAATYFQMSYVLDKVNPDSIAAYQVKEAMVDQKREFRWCLEKAMVQVVATPTDRTIFMRCAD